MAEGQVDGEFIGLCRAKSLDTRSAVGKNQKKKDWALSPALSATDFICVYNKFFSLLPRCEGQADFFSFILVCVSSVLRHSKNGQRLVLGHRKPSKKYF